MARTRMTARKRVGDAREYRRLFVRQPPQVPDVLDPEAVEAYEREHDEALLAEIEVADPAPTVGLEVFEYPETDPEEDSEEDPTEPDTEIAPPEDIPYGSTEVSSPEMMRVDVHQRSIERLLDRISAAQARVAELESETGVADLMDRMIALQARVTALTEELEAELGASTPVRTPTSSPVPVSPVRTETDDGMDPILDGVAATPANSPLPPPLPVISLAVHDWVVGRYAADLTAAEARITELRDQLSIERHMRIEARARRGYPSARRVRRTIRRIELRTIGRIHRLSPQRDLVSRREVIRVVVRAMRRIRDVTHG
ncbi:uncharacterized protein LOC141688953 [Apium graveolens]|uniref:uncharacterized protein LOC141688953 n=1 Tax=Apium graveolens TaxID=4045 RepID=UPI003D7981B5